MTPNTVKKQLKNEPSDLELKFNIRERLLRHGPLKRTAILNVVKKASKKSMTTVKRLVYRRADDPAQNDYEILKAFAAVWKISIEELENPKI